ncbi:MAG: CotH kinase family protein [Flavobacteriales bacterium]|nr:CotH kinase family protein [Flavobacteriales bacterium]
MAAGISSWGLPISRLFMAMYRNDTFRAKFLLAVEALLDGPLSAKRCTSELETMVALMTPEMERHTARWRKPLDREAWEQEVNVVRAYAKGREAACREQLARLRDKHNAE